MQLRVEKSDGSSEVYLHTKVMGVIARSLAESDGYRQGQPEQLAEAVTTYLRRRHHGGIVTSDEIHSMVEVVLYDTGYERAALLLHEHRVNRQIRRRRIEVVNRIFVPGSRDSDDLELSAADEATARWNKSVIVRDLEEKYSLAHNLARAAAGAVEEKVLGLGCRRVTLSLVKELVANELWSMLQAEKSLAASEAAEKEGITADTVCGAERPADYEAVAVESG
ncbi:MAG: hypothetical protein AMJ79_02660 [Phycisphaerae bacterium SM23_30]|nr:MAG: hypothetical protein AMJ79_02660 [Phycisphaerae bacterium SM23_30]